MTRNSYEKRFTGADLVFVLSNEPSGLMLARIQERMKCSEMTVRNLLKPLIASGRVIKLNLGSSDKRPVNLYVLEKEVYGNGLK